MLRAAYPGLGMIRPWALPLIVAAIAIPIAAGFMVAGPALGLAIGALVGAAMIVVVARMRPHEKIEVARATDQRHRVLVVTLAPIEDPGAASEVAELARPDSEVLVLSPALNRPLAHWASDLEGARDAAQRRLVLSLGSLAAAKVDARGAVGDSDTVQAVADTLREFPADEAVLIAQPMEGKGPGARALATLRSRLDLPLRLIEV
jgi:hypothetical protein